MRQLLKLKPLLSPSRPPRADLPDMSAIAPARPLYVIGDVHGSADLVEDLLERIDADMAQHMDAGTPHLVFVGDYVDRGDESNEVLEHVFALCRDLPGAVTGLMGNHERMMLDFIDDPAGRGARWLANGGMQTLASFKIGKIMANSPVEDMTAAADALSQAMPKGMEDWLRALPLHYQSGNVLCVHAAVNPAKPVETQDERALLWGHRDFFKSPQKDGLWVVHGHTIVETPEIAQGRIAVDTGAYHSGRLTAAVITAGACRFL